MSIHIDRTACIGCGQCAEICPGTLIRMTDGKAEMRYPKECWGCVSCVKQCPDMQFPCTWEQISAAWAAG